VGIPRSVSIKRVPPAIASIERCEVNMRTEHTMTRAAIQLALLGLLSAALSCSHGPGTDDPIIPTNDQHNEMLSSLLGRTVDTGGPKNSAGESLRPDYNPYGKANAILSKESEFFLFGCDFDSGGVRSSDYSSVAEAFFDGKNSFNINDAAHITPSAFAWSRLPKKGAGADVDGDGKEEVCVAYLGAPFTPTGGVSQRKLLLSIYDGSPTNSSALATDLVIDTFAESAIDAYYPAPLYASWNSGADIDGGFFTGGDQAELAITAMGRVYLVGGAAVDYRSLGQYSSFTSTAVMQVLRAAAADIDGDGEDELAVMDGNLNSAATYGTNGIARLYALDADSSGALSSKADADGLVLMTKSATFYSGGIAAGDVDADGLAEIVVCGNTSTGNVYTAVFDDSEASKPFGLIACATNDKANNFNTMACEVLDYDGDGVKDILGWTRIFHQTTNLNADGSLKTLLSAFATSLYCDDMVAVGQFNDSRTTVDRYEDLAFVVGNLWDMGICTTNADGVAAPYSGNLWDGGNQQFYPCLFPANVDEDSSYVSFEGRELLYTDPRVISFLSCYPYWEGIEMDGNSSYSWGENTSTSGEHTVGMSVGVSFGASFSFLGTGASVKASLETSLDYSTGRTHEQSISSGFTAGREDKVVWTAIPFDVYYYKVVRSPYLKAGETLTVSMPRAPIMTATEVGYYNAHNGDGADIGAENLVTHSMGVPSSYPSPDFVKARIADGTMVIYKDDANIHPGNGKTATQVGVGVGNSFIDLSYSDAATTTIASDISITVETEASVGGVTIGASAGFHYGYSYSVENGTQTAFHGEIGDIPAGTSGANLKTFPYSLFVYKKPLVAGDPSSEEVLVLEYCYEGT
jgi:hypothetical protein